MRHLLYTLVFVALVPLTSCSVYRTSPTPDDVYYSPGVPADETASASGNNSDDYYSAPNENYVRMRVQDPERWSYFDDYNSDYYGGYSPLGYASPYSYNVGLSLGFGYSPWMMGGFGYYSPFSYWNSYYAWNNYYNPYYGGITVVNGKNFNTPAYTRLSTFNPASYQSRSSSNRPNNSNRFYNGNVRTNNSSPVRRSPNYNANNTNNRNNNYTRPTYSRPQVNNTQPVRSAPANYGGGSSGGGGGSRGGGGGVRPGR
jgi:hypothetical protein